VETANLFDIIMTHVAIHFVTGNAFFAGIAVLIASSCAEIFSTKSAFSLLKRIGAAAGAIIIGMSATPLPIWLYLFWTVPVLLVLFDWRSAPDGPPWSKHGASILLIVVSIIAALVELPYHIKPNVSARHAKEIIVIGDSISAGIGIENDLWPEILQRELKFEVANLSAPGARVADAVEKAAGLDKYQTGNSVIILEIGGNDILARTETDTFEKYLDRIFSYASEQSDTIIVLELPLPPFGNSYGRIQRKLARKYNARLIPKRYFAGIIARPEATVDGLHLSPIGHQMFADMILDVLAISEDD
jgi:acyl-CoA thioesterase-1